MKTQLSPLGSFQAFLPRLRTKHTGLLPPPRAAVLVLVAVPLPSLPSILPVRVSPCGMRDSSVMFFKLYFENIFKEEIYWLDFTVSQKCL